MAAHLTEAFRLGRVEKVYWAVVVGIPKPGAGKIAAPLSKPRGEKIEKVIVDEEHGKSAITHYRILKKLGTKFAWLELSPETGRTHQLRVHCAYIGHPIVGDGKYGGALATQYSRELHLHSSKITFSDRQGNKLTFVAPPPQHMQDILKKFAIEYSQI
jgi:23S rRNA pseudouridine955/2504/2580 synthase